MSEFALILVICLSIFAVVFAVGAVVITLRNDSANEYRVKIIEILDKESKADILAGHEWKWRYREFDRVSHFEMVFKFWRSFDSFYPDKEFLQPGPTKQQSWLKQLRETKSEKWKPYERWPDDYME